jgi:hypothetical protein
MRFTRALTLTLLVALPLVAQQPTVVNQPAAEPLSARLNYNGYGLISFESNRSAFVALFDVTRDGLRQLYPESRYQAELATSFRYLSNPISFGFGGFHSPLFWNSMYGWSGYGFGSYIAAPQWHTLLLVASSAPLKLGYSMSNELKISNALFRQGLGFRMDTDEGFAAIIKQIAPIESDAEITMDWLDVPPSSYPSYNGYQVGGMCFPAFGFLTGFSATYTNTAYCDYQRDLASARRFVTSGPIAGTKPVTMIDTTAVKNGSDKGIGTTAGNGQQSPDEIRRLVQRLRDAEGGNLSATYKMGGATTATRGGYRDDGTGRTVGGVGRTRENGGNGFFAPSGTRAADTGPAPIIFHERTQAQSTRGGFSAPPPPPPEPRVAPTPLRPQVDLPKKPQH